jgi:hypothetical protein
MKKMTAAIISSNGILNKPATMKGLMVFRNTPRSPSNRSPAELIFSGPMRDRIPMRRQALLPQFRFNAENQIQKHNTAKMPEEVKKKELPLLATKILIQIQDPHNKKWSKTGFVISFGANYHKYIVRSGHKTYRRNRHFIKPINDEKQPMPDQPVRPPPLKPATPLGSKFPVKDDWWSNPQGKESEKEEGEGPLKTSETPLNQSKTTQKPKTRIQKPTDITWPNKVPLG